MNFKETCKNLHRLGISVHFVNNGFIVSKNGKDIHCENKEDVMLIANRVNNHLIENESLDSLPFHHTIIH